MPPVIVEISKCLVKPSSLPPSAANNVCHLSLWDLFLFNHHYIQKGLLFSNVPSSLSIESIIDRLKSSLSVALCHFYPLAGRLVTEQVVDNSNEVSGLQVSIDCRSQGAEFIHAVANNLTVADVLADDVPSFVQSFFPLNGAISHDGHTLPLLVVQLTELSDGVFVACCFNHAVGDGTAYWHFLNAWAEIARSKEGEVAFSRPPVHDRWFLEGEITPPITLPYSHASDFIERFSPPPLRQKFFHFPSHSVAQLKAKANKECDTDVISSLQALSALVWRSITRVRRLPPDQSTGCSLAIQDRARLRPPLSPDYFGNVMVAVTATTTTSELLTRGLGQAALLLHQAVRAHTDDVIRGMARGYLKKPSVYRFSKHDKNGVIIASSPRFDMYGCDFGWGKPLALRSGNANKYDGMVITYPGREGGGSVDLEICLLPEYMYSLEVDEELMAAVSLPLQ